MRVAGFLMLSVVLLSCAGTDVGNPQSRELSVEFIGFDESAPNALTFDSGLVISELWLSLSALRLRDAALCEEEGDFYLHGPFLVELVSGREFPPLSTRLELQSLCRISLDFALYAGSIPEAPDAMRDHSILIRGSSADGQAFEIALSRNEVVHLRNTTGLVSLLPQNDHLLISFALNEWFQAGELDVEAFDSSNAAATAKLWTVIKRSIRLYRDSVPDGLLQDSELLDQLATGEF
ncbi:MAG: hypothetical protein RBU37_05415 [Myxococcota bacterium]|jgi:hypothetical protein|nr:hypothetical protein [Myxococcota bacterium]